MTHPLLGEGFAMKNACLVAPGLVDIAPGQASSHSPSWASPDAVAR
jgi:hypothetical protein